MTFEELFIDLHATADRQGPGSTTDTLRALEFTGLTEKKDLRVADIGCGSGGQTLTLAEHIDGQITAVDLFPAFLEELKKRAARKGFTSRIRTLEASMDSLPFQKNSLDLIWSEGAIYTIGFEKGIRQWKEFLKPGGYLAVSEITWITSDRPKEINDFWRREYPEIALASKKIQVLEENGYTLTGYFNLPEESWTEHYYKPLEAGFQAFLHRHDQSDEAQRIVSEHLEEINWYRQYKSFYTYGFYIARNA